VKVPGDVCELPPNLTYYHSNVPWAIAKLFVNIIIPIQTFTDDKILVKIDPVLLRYSVGYANFCPVLCPGVAKMSTFALVISEVTGLMFTIFTRYCGVCASVDACILVDILQFVVE